MRIPVGLWSILLTGVACGGGSGPTGAGNNPPPPPPPPPPPSGQVVNVSMTDNGGSAPYAFAEATLTVRVGTTVRWTNNGKAPHTSTSDAAPQPIWNSGTVEPAGTTSCDPNDPYCQPGTTPAGTYQRTFDTQGTYQYSCQLHGQQGMTGTITVTP